MKVFDSPLDVLAFDYASLGILTVFSNPWTWVAVFTAGVSFWRIRATGATVKHEQPFPASIDSVADSPRPIPEVSLVKPVKASTTATVMSQAVFEDNDGVTKGKFVAYFEAEKGRDGNVECGGETTIVRGRICYDGSDDRHIEEWWEDWGRLLVVKMGDRSWYKYQDLTAISGNVVRLWDGVRRRKYISTSLGN